MNLGNFFVELKRRNVYKVAIAYAIVAWLLMQIASQIFPFFDIPNWAVRLVVLLLIIGFPVALILAWAFELTPEGIKRTEDVDLSKSIARKSGRKLDFLIIAVLLLVIAGLIFQRLHRNVSPAIPSSLEKSVAVLPFQNLSKDEENAFFADGVQDQILTDLAKVADLKVISRTSVMQYKNVATRKELGPLSQFDLPAVKAVVIFTLPRPRPGNEAIGNLEEVNGRLSSWGDGRPTFALAFCHQFPCQVSQDLVETNGLAPFLAK